MQCYHLPRRRRLALEAMRWATMACARRSRPTCFARWASSSPGSGSEERRPNSRWLSDIQGRLGKCIQFGLRSDTEHDACRRISQTLASSWKGLVAGAEGFSVEPAAAGLPDPIWAERVLWGEMDSMGHVNNAHYLRYSETSRIWYFRRLRPLVQPEQRAMWDTLLTPTGLGLILKSIKVDYLLPVTYPDTLSLIHSLGPLGGGDPPTEITLRCWMLSHAHQRVAARAEENVPLYDYRAGKKAPLPPWLLELLETMRQHEDASRRYWTSVRANIEGWLKGLEDATVHSGREEDMGSATSSHLSHEGPIAPTVAEVMDPGLARDVNAAADTRIDITETNEKETVVFSRDEEQQPPKKGSWAKESPKTWGVKP